VYEPVEQVGEHVNHETRGDIMLSWAVTFLVVAIIAGVLGLSGVAGTATSIAYALFVIFILLALIGFITGRKPTV
jgi:uncharacterized membrane protein YtjA (UPF0391 family)